MNYGVIIDNKMKFVETVNDYSVIIDGKWGRNRKVKREHFTLANDQLNELSEQELDIKLKQFLNEIRFKSGAVFVTMYKVERSTETMDGVTFQVKTLNPLGYRVVKQIRL